ncbi:NAD(P)-dependent oxidoreductase [Salinispora arenicola]|uniref:NAD-dependent epimerase/dehydratase family protein n=1 Tax=Salinispora arenicola TaxID=168697 RepID=UPI0003AA7F76|nr:NAD(P)-dependent oxidoreductase [Salinispora arenicola]
MSVRETESANVVVADKDNAKKRVVVTGGRGFIGQAAARALINRGYQPAIYDLPDADVRDGKAIRAAMEGSHAVIHLAGVLGTHELFDAIDLAIDINVKGATRVLEAVKDCGARYVGLTLPAVFPSVYAATKGAAVAMERAFHHTYGVPVSRVLAFNAYGPAQKHGPGNPQKILPTFAVEAWANRPIPIWGDGSQTVDLVHVDDLGDLLVDAIGHGDNFTLDGGTGKAVSVNDLANFVIEVTGSTAGVRHMPMRRGEVPTEIVATGQGWDRIDWRPQLDWDRVAESVESYRHWNSPAPVN